MTKDELVEKVRNVIAQIEMDREGYPLSRTQEEIYDDADEMACAALAIAMPAAFEMAAEVAEAEALSWVQIPQRSSAARQVGRVIRAEGEKWK